MLDVVVVWLFAVAEETKNASTSSPWGIIATCVTVSVLGFLYIVG